MNTFLGISACLLFTCSSSFAAPPSDAVAKPASPTTVNLSWKDNSSDEIVFKIVRRKSGAPKFNLIATVPANTTTFVDTELTSGTRYYYHVSASSVGGDSELSNKADIILPQVLPLAPTKLVATVLSNAQINLAWGDASVNESGFKIERKTASGAFEQVIITPENTAAYANRYLPESTQFVYRVCATNSAGDSAWSNEAKAATQSTDEYRKNPRDLWVGTYQQRAGQRFYMWIPTRDATIEVQKDGKVKLICPETKPALEGKNTCQRFVYDESYRQLDADYLKELFSTGVNLPDGQYAFHIRYANAPKDDYAHVDAKTWDLFHKPGTWPTNSAISEMVSFSIEGGASTPGAITLPTSQRRVSFLATYMYLNDKLVLPPNKDFGVGRYANDTTGKIDDLASLQDLFARKITHLNDIPYGILQEKFSPDNRWRAARCEMENRTEQIQATIEPGETWETTFQTKASDPEFMIGDWHHHHFIGDLKGCEYKSQDSGGGKLKVTIKNPTASVQNIQGSFLIRVVWTPKTAAEAMPLGTKFIFLAEFAENGMLNKIGNPFAPIEEVYKIYYERLQKKFGVTSAAQTNSYYDYFGHIYGYSTSGPNLMFSKPDEQRASMSSPEKARGNSGYYAQEAYKYRNRSGGAGYMDNPLNSGEQIYGVVYSLETNFIAMPDIKVGGMAWQATDGTPGGVTSHGLYYRRRYPGGDIIQRQDTGHPHEIMKTRCFFHLLLANTHLLWESGAVFSKNLERFSTLTSGSTPLLWQPTGGEIVTWEENNPKFPQPVQNPEFKKEGGFPSQPQVGEQGAWTGAYLYSQISTASDKISKSIHYPKFSYSISGGETSTGYEKSNEPVKGKLGAEVSRFGVSNPGQHNIVDSYHAKKPIVMLTEGSQGSAVIIKNIWVKPTDVVSYKIQTGSGEKVITHTGRLLGVFALK